MSAPLARNTDPETSHMAAESVATQLNRLQRMVLDAFRRHGAMTTEELGKLPIFDGLAESTTRGRCPELEAAGLLRRHGQKKNSRGRQSTIWTVAVHEPQTQRELF